MVKPPLLEGAEPAVLDDPELAVLDDPEAAVLDGPEPVVKSLAPSASTSSVTVHGSET